MVGTNDIEKNTNEETGHPLCFYGSFGEFSWSASPSWAQGPRKFKVSVSRTGVRGSAKCVATRANFENIADIIANHINTFLNKKDK